MKKGKTLFSKIIITVLMFVLLLGAMGNDVYASTILKKGMIGIDVSKHQGSIDWDRVKKSGQASFVIIRVGYGNDETSQDDEYAEYNMRECERLNIPYGVYLFSYALSEAEAYSEVEHIKRMLNGRKPPMGVYIDVEASSYYEQNGLEYMSDAGRRRITDYVKIILRGISAMGCSAGYYANVNYNEHVLYKDELSGYRWIAGYGDYQGYSEENGALIWQYSSNGSISGINARVDMDMLLQDFVIGSDSNGTTDTSGWRQNSKGKWYQYSDGTYPANQWKQIGGKWYYFNASGYVTTGWLNIGKKWYYLDSEGVMVTDRWVDGVYYVKSDGTMAVSEWVNNDKYYVDEKGQWVPDKVKVVAGWNNDATGKWYQNEDGTRPSQGWKQIGGKWYYFNENGYVTTGWLSIGKTWYYLDSEGVMVTDRWVDGVYYVKSDGTMAVSEWVNNDKYYVDEKGQWVPGKTKYTASWMQDNAGKWYLNSDGTYPVNQLKQIDGKWYYFNASGYVATGWVSINGNWYYMNSEGVMQTGWVNINNTWYYFDTNGVMVTDRWVDGVYYVKSNGTMAVSEWVNNDKYYVDEKGQWVPGKTKYTASWMQDNAGKWYLNSDGTYPKSQLKQIDGKWYYFNASGYVVTGWVSINGNLYYMNSEGVMQTNKWISNVYYVKSDGTMAKSEWVDNNRYYVGADGKWVQGAKH